MKLLRRKLLFQITKTCCYRWLYRMLSSTVPESNGDLRVHTGTMKRRTKSSTEEEEESAPTQGLWNAKAMTVLIVWYIVSFIVIILNKYILTTLGGDAAILSSIQMIVITILSYANMKFPCGLYKQVKREHGYPSSHWRNMMVVGITRFGTVFLGIVALKFVAVSFTETVKSSAPIFTVILSRLLIGEKNGLYVQMSLLPIMLGLALCSAYELSFNIQGFISALGTNLCECLQFVYSKLLISGDKFQYTPGEFQYYSSLASIAVQVPACFLLVDLTNILQRTDRFVLGLMLLNGIFLFLQTTMAFILMSFISPVTHSVSNTVKRALMIWGSVLVFGNSVTFLSGLGTMVVFAGVLFYNKAREIEQMKMTLVEKYGGDVQQESDVKHV